MPSFVLLKQIQQIDDNIVKVYQASQVVQLPQTVGHQMLKSSQGIA